MERRRRRDLLGLRHVHHDRSGRQGEVLRKRIPIERVQRLAFTGKLVVDRQALQGASFTSVSQLRQAMDRFVSNYNLTAIPFEWTKRVVLPGQLKHRYADLLN